MISDLFVHPQVHGQGIGTALLAALPTAGACFTFSSRHPAAQAAYRRIGLAPQWRLLYLAGPVLRHLPEAHPLVPDLLAAGYAEVEHDLAMARGVELPTDREYSPGRG
jgi:hypothetical protein